MRSARPPHLRVRNELERRDIRPQTPDERDRDVGRLRQQPPPTRFDYRTSAERNRNRAVKPPFDNRRKAAPDIEEIAAC